MSYCVTYVSYCMKQWAQSLGSYLAPHKEFIRSMHPPPILVTTTPRILGTHCIISFSGGGDPYRLNQIYLGVIHLMHESDISMEYIRFVCSISLGTIQDWYFVPLESSETTKINFNSLYCSSPRKSLVKGERFIRGEEKPELTSKHASENYFNEKNSPIAYTAWLVFYCSLVL